MPPSCPYLAATFSGQGCTKVWITRSSGFGTFQTSLTPSSHTCGSRPSARSNSLIAAPESEPQQPSARTVACALMSVPGSKFAERLAVLAAALVARAHAHHASVLDDQLGRRGLGENVGPAVFGLALLKASERGDRDHLVAVVLEVRHRQDRDRKLGLWAGEHVHRLLLDLAEGEAFLAPVLARQIRKQLFQGRGAHDRAGEVVPAAGLGLLHHRDRHFAEALHRLRIVCQQLQQAVGARQARCAPADDRHAHLDQLVLGVEAVLDELLR